MPHGFRDLYGAHVSSGFFATCSLVSLNVHSSLFSMVSMVCVRSFSVFCGLRVSLASTWQKPHRISSSKPFQEFRVGMPGEAFSENMQTESSKHVQSIHRKQQTQDGGRMRSQSESSGGTGHGQHFIQEGLPRSGARPCLTCLFGRARLR